ncbi:MAG: putative porin [Proteobacteria bacterium]|nr:putative porin [Pseudomonadota bacterium]
MNRIIATVAFTALLVGATSALPIPAISAVDGLDLSGDFRLRHESTFVETGRDRHRERVRARIGATYSINDEITLGARLVTGNTDDPNSSHQTFGSSFNDWDVALDRAWIGWKPAAAEGLSITAGKFSHVLKNYAVYNELVWDGDVQPEGIALVYSAGSLGKLDNVRAAVTTYILNENGNGNEVTAVTAGVSASTTVGQAAVKAALNYYHYSDLTPGGDQTVFADNSGNRTDMAGNDFLSDFDIINPSFSVSCDHNGLPVTMSGEFIANTGAEPDEDYGWSLGVKAGSKNEVGDMQGYYQWQVVGQDAVLSVVSQDDMTVQTNLRAHIVGLHYKAFDNVDVHPWLLVSRADDALGSPNDDDWRARLDINVKF